MRHGRPFGPLYLRLEFYGLPLWHRQMSEVPVKHLVSCHDQKGMVRAEFCLHCKYHNSDPSEIELRYYGRCSGKRYASNGESFYEAYQGPIQPVEEDHAPLRDLRPLVVDSRP